MAAPVVKVVFEDTATFFGFMGAASALVFSCAPPPERRSLRQLAPRQTLANCSTQRPPASRVGFSAPMPLACAPFSRCSAC